MPEIEIKGKKIKIPYTKKGKKLAIKLKKKKSSYGDQRVSKKHEYTTGNQQNPAGGGE
jgi:hypothetical protein